MVIGGAAPLLDTTIVSVALDALGRNLTADLATIQWTMSGYLLAMAMVTPATGWAVDRFGARRMWIGSVLAFGLASVLAGLAWSAGQWPRRFEVAALLEDPSRTEELARDRWFD